MYHLPRRKYVAKKRIVRARNRSARRSWLSNLWRFFFVSLYSYSGTHCHSGVRAHHVHRVVPHAHTQGAKTSVPHWSGVHFVGIFDIHSVRVPEEEIINSRYVYSVEKICIL